MSGRRIVDEQEWVALADRALTTGRHAAATIRGRQVVAIPDVLAAEFAANGTPRTPTSTWTVQRDDGRAAYLYAVSAGVAL